jgi:hypothetical protein
MADKEKLTDRTLKSLKPAKKGQRYERMDNSLSGFGVRVTDKGKRGRPDGFLADVIANTAKQVFETTTERKAVRSVSRDDGQPQGEFNNFLRDIFEILGVEASADAANRKMQKK